MREQLHPDVGAVRLTKSQLGRGIKNVCKLKAQHRAVSFPCKKGLKHVN